ncbi:unnamed protein product [Urochloa humidicola]
MKPPAASPGRAEKPQLPAPGLARLLLSKSRRGGRSRRAPATSPMFVSRGRSRAADGEPSSPKVTCIGQVRMRKGKKGKKAAAAASKTAAAAEKGGAKGYCRCLKKAFLCGGLFEFDSRKRRQKAPSPEVERARRSPWVFSSRDVAVAAAPKAADPSSGGKGELGHEDDDEEEMVVGVGVFGSIGREEGEKMMGIGGGDGEKGEEDEEGEAQLVSSATTTPPKNALLLMRCRSAPQNRTSPLTSRFLPSAAAAAVPSPTKDVLAAVALEIAASPSPSPSPRKPEKVSPTPRKLSTEKALGDDEDGGEKRQEGAAAAPEQGAQSIGGQGTEEEEEEDEFEEEDEEMRCSSARPLVLQRCKSEPATTAAAKMAAGGGASAEATTAGCFWAHGGSSGRRRHAPPPPAAGAPVALTGH